eukprot:2941495-Amphidinium_carterae.1
MVTSTWCVCSLPNPRAPAILPPPVTEQSQCSVSATWARSSMRGTKNWANPLCLTSHPTVTHRSDVAVTGVGNECECRQRVVSSCLLPRQ